MRDTTQLLKDHELQFLSRKRRVVNARNDSLAVVDGVSVINFCGNDYLNLATHEAVKQSFAKSAAQLGLGSSGSALVSGYSSAHAELEHAFATFLKREKAILFNSGYHANLGVLTTFADKHSVIIADKYSHASLNTGALLSRAKFVRYKHNDLQQAESLLSKYASHASLLVTESVFSMQGSIIDASKISSIARKNNSMLIIDDAHGIGVLGKNGAGVCEQFELSQQDVACLVTPLGKALGSYGAIVSGEKHIIEALLQFAGSYRYCTALPPAVCEATLTALHVLQNETWRREKLLHLCKFFLNESHARGIKLASSDLTPIMSIVIGCNEKTLHIQQQLLTKGILISCIRPPTVPKNQTLIRISLCSMHEEKQIIHLLDNLKEHYHAT